MELIELNENLARTAAAVQWLNAKRGGALAFEIQGALDGERFVSNLDALRPVLLADIQRLVDAGILAEKTDTHRMLYITEYGINVLYEWCAENGRIDDDSWASFAPV